MPCTYRSLGRNPNCDEDTQADIDLIEAEVVEIERHLHSDMRWFEVAATPNGEIHVADRIGGGQRRVHD